MSDNASIVTTHENISGNKIIYAGETYSAVYNSNGGAFSLVNGATLTGEGTEETPILFRNNYANGHGGAIYNLAGATVSLSNIDFSGNTAANAQNNREGGAIANAGTLSISGATFSGNRAAYGGAIRNIGYLRIGDVVFDGNSAASGNNGGAIWLQGGSIEITGKITLKQESDTLVNYNKAYPVTIDVDAFKAGTDGKAYYLVIDAVSTAQWSQKNGAFEPAVDAGSGYEKAVVGADVYLKSTDAEYDFTSAVFSADGTTESIVIGGTVFKGVAYVYDDTALAAAWGATNLIYDNLPASAAVTMGVSAGTGLRIKGGTFQDMTARAILNKGSVTLENVSFIDVCVSAAGAAIYNGENNQTPDLSITGGLFSGNVSTSEAGAVYNRVGAVLTISGTTFSANSGTYGGAISNTGTLRIGNVVFDGNQAASNAQGGAIWTQGGTTTITGLITLKQASDTLANFGAAVAVDADAFTAGTAGSPYYKVIDAVSSAQWSISGRSFLPTIVTGEGYAVKSAGADVYITSTSVDFTNAVITADGTATQLVIAGQTFNGIAYSYENSDAPAVFGAKVYLYENLPDTLATGKTVNSGETLGIKGGSFHDLTTKGITNNAGGTVLLEDVDFVNINVGSAEGGAIFNNSTMTISGATFSGNAAKYGGAIKNTGTLRIGDVLFSGNQASSVGNGGAIWNQNSGSSVIITGLITLATATDTLRNFNGSTYTIDAASFGDDAYYKVIDAIALTQWQTGSNPIGTPTVTGEGFTAQTYGTDLYIKSTDTSKHDFTKAVLTAEGTASALVIAGQTFSGVGYSYDDAAMASSFGAASYYYENLPDAMATAQNITSGKSLGIKGGSFHDMTARAIYNAAGATTALENVTFSKINLGTGSPEGGAVNNAGTMYISGATFTGNTAGYGGALRSGGYLRIGDVVFDGNVATSTNTGGALWLQGGSVEITGLLTLKQASDTLVNFKTGAAAVTVDVDSFTKNGDKAYFKIVDALSASQWKQTNGTFLPTVAGGQGYEVKSSTDIYLKSTDAKYDFTNAVITADGTATQLVIAGQTFTGIAYSYEDSDAPAVFGAKVYLYENLPDTLATAKTVQSGETLAIKGGTFHNLAARAITNTGTLILENVDFSGVTDSKSGAVIMNGGTANADTTIKGGLFDGNTSTGEAGGIYNYAGSSLTISGATFSRNRGSYGAGISNYGTLRIGGVVFDGNSASQTARGGAIWTQSAAAVTVTGMITLMTDSDTIISYQSVPTWTIETAAFDGSGWSKVFNSSNRARWISANYITPDDTENYETVALGNDLYLHQKGVVAPTVIFSAGGEEESVVVCGESFSGIGALTTEYSSFRSKGANNWIFDGYTLNTPGQAFNVAGNSVAADAAFALKNSNITANYYSFGNNTTVTGDVNFLMENSTITGSVYAAGSAGITDGDLNIRLVGSTINGKLSPTSSDTASDVGAYNISLTGSIVTGAIRGTGVSTKMAVGSVNISLTDSYAGGITCLYGSNPEYGFYGNKVNGHVTVTLAGSTVAGDIVRNSADYTTEFTSTVSLTVTGNKSTAVTGNLTGMDSITINAGAALTYYGSAFAAEITNNGTFTVGGGFQAAPAGSSYDTYNFASGSTGTFTTVNGGFTNGNSVYYYCVVDSTMTSETKSVVIEGVTTSVVYGVNAFTSTAAAKAAHAGTAIVVVNETFSGNYYGEGETKISGGTVAKTTYGGKLIKSDNAAAGDSSLTVSGGTFQSMIVGGHRVSVSGGSSAAVTAGTSSLTVTGGDLSDSHLVAGGYVINNGDGASLTVTESNLTLANITSTKYAFGGVFVNGGTASVGTSNVAVSSGSYKSVFGGGWAQKGTSAVTTANIVVTGGSIHNLYAGGTDNGSTYAGTVGTANLTISGGTVRNVILNGKYSRDTVGTATLNITGSCKLNWIEGLCHTMVGDSKKTVTTLNIGASFTVEDILHVDTWNFNTIGAKVDFGSHTADLNGTTEAEIDTVLNFNVGTESIGSEGWTAVAAKAFDGLKASSIQINGEATTYQDNVWSYGDYTVTLTTVNDTHKSLVVAKVQA